MVGAVYLRVALQAGAADREAIGGLARARRMPGRDVTGLAQTRHVHLEHRAPRAAMRVVAVEAVLGHRRVLPQERAALLRVTGQTLVVHGDVADQALGD